MNTHNDKNDSNVVQIIDDIEGDEDDGTSDITLLKDIGITDLKVVLR